MNVLRLLLAVLLASVPTVARAAETPPAWTSVTFGGVKLGEPMSAVRARLGDPVHDEDLGKGFLKARYLGDHNHVYLGVTHKNGNVAMVSLTPTPWSNEAAAADPFGVKFGITEDALVRLRGKPDSTDNGDGANRLLYGTSARWEYVIKDGKVSMITLIAPPAELAALPATVVPAAHQGASFRDAVVVIASNEIDGVGWEHIYVNDNACTGQGKPAFAGQALSTHGSHAYDIITVTCGGDKKTSRDYIFDITAYFGKL